MVKERARRACRAIRDIFDRTEDRTMCDPRPGVLIVDDLPSNRRMLVRTLSALDVALYEAGSGEEALAIVEREPHLFVALLDVRMPGMDGYTLAETLRQVPQAVSLPIIFISAHEPDAYQPYRAYESGAVDFLSKPVSPRVLLSKVSVFLDLYRQRSELETVVQELAGVNKALSQQTVRLETGAEVMRQIISILDVDALLVRILSLIRERFGYTFAGIWMIGDRSDGEGSTIVLRAGQYGTPAPAPEPSEAISLDAPRSIIAHVCRTGAPYLSNDVQSDTVYLPTDRLPTIRAELTLPLRTSAAYLGALDIQSESSDAFTAEDVTALTTLADQISVAIRNARLYAEVQRLNESLESEVTERTQELESAYRHLELLDRNKSDFITVVSHELRTPLTLIHGFSQMLRSDPVIAEDEIRNKEVEGIVNGANRLHGIVNSMLDVVKIENRTLRLNRERISLGYLLEVLHTRMAPVLEERRLSLTTQGLAMLPEIDADSEALTKVFNELLSNAVKYTPDGGTISVEARKVARGDEDTEFYVEVVVHDTGIGIDPEALEMIFTKFYRTGEVTLHSSGKTKFKGGGPGLGLTVARGIVEAHGGRIWAVSTGHDEAVLPGSAFHVLLPAH